MIHLSRIGSGVVYVVGLDPIKSEHCSDCGFVIPAAFTEVRLQEERISQILECESCIPTGSVRKFYRFDQLGYESWDWLTPVLEFAQTDLSRATYDLETGELSFR